MTDRAIFVGTLVLAGIYFYATENLPSLEIGDPLGPKAFPRLLGVALLVAAVMQLLEILKARKTVQPVAAPAQPVDRRTYLVVAAASVWTFLFFLTFEWLGYVVAGSIYLIVLTVYFNKGRLLMNVTVSVLFSLGSYLLFTKALGVNLARGILPF